MLQFTYSLRNFLVCWKKSLFAQRSCSPSATLTSMDDTAGRYAAQFGSLLELFNLKQHVAVPTHRSGHILDLVISRKDVKALKVNELIVF